MAFRWIWWRNTSTSTTGAGSRPTGLQITTPLSYAAEAASTVTIDTAFQVSAVWAATKLIAETIASMPIKLYDVDKNGVKTRNFNHPLAKLFAGKLNKWQTRIEFIETMTMQLTLQGNCFALIQRNGAGEIIGLMPFMSQEMEVALTENGDIFYKYSENSANAAQYEQDKVLHVKCMGNGIVGLSPLGYARNAIGIAQAAEQSVTKIYSNGAKPSGILSFDKVLNDVQRAAIKSNFAALEEGTQDRLFVLEAGMTYQQVSMTPQDIELLATRRFQIEDIARFFGVPSVMINDTSASTVWGSGIQQIVEGFYKLGIRPYLERYEESFKQWLLKPEERGQLEIEFDFQEFLRPDQAERIKTYGEAVSKGIMTPNQARALEGWPDLPGGDKAFMQQQMIPLDMLGTVQQPATVKAEHELKMADSVKPPVNNITVNMPDIKMERQEINVKAGDVTVPSTVNMPEHNISIPAPEVKVEVLPPVVNVAAPSVNVAAPAVKVDVAAPNVQVTPTVNVKLPKRKTKTEVKYDTQDRITQTTQIEEDM